MANCSEDSVLKTVSSILNKSTPEKFDLLKAQLLDAGCITNTNILQGVVSLIFEKAVLEPTFCPVYSRLCSDLHEMLPPFPSEELGGKGITFRRILVNNCQQAFEEAFKFKEYKEIGKSTGPELELACSAKERSNNKLRSLGIVRLIGELLKQKVIIERIAHHVVQGLLGHQNTVPAEENVEALCLFFTTIGELRGETKNFNNKYFNRLRELSENPLLAPRLRSMVRDVLVFSICANKWNPRREEAKASFQYTNSSPAEDCSGPCTSCGRIFSNEAVEEIIQDRDAYRLQNQTMAKTIQSLTTTIHELHHSLDARNEEWTRRLQHEKRKVELRLDTERSRHARKLELITEGLQQLVVETQVLDLDQSDEEEEEEHLLDVTDDDWTHRLRREKASTPDFGCREGIRRRAGAPKAYSSCICIE